MMPLQSTRDAREDCFDDLFSGVDREDIVRMDELHATRDDDVVYVFVVWLRDPDRTDEVIAQISKNTAGNLGVDVRKVIPGMLMIVEDVT